MRYSKLVAAILATLALSACVAGIIVPVPVSSGSHDATEQENRR